MLPRHISEILRDGYGIDRYELRQLDGEVDLNYRVTTPAGTTYLLKVSRPETEAAEVDFQRAILAHLAQKELPFIVPQLVKNQVGDQIELFASLSGRNYVRLQTWVAGHMLDSVNPRTPQLWRQWGQTAAHLQLALSDFDHPHAHRSYVWNPSETLLSRPLAAHITDPNQREIAHYFWDLFTEHALPLLPQLRKTINYNDAHEHNILVNESVENPLVCGVIDFGDVLYTEAVNEVAIACAYAGMHQPDPLGAMAEVVSGFHQISPLQEKELSVLFYLVTARLLITVSRSAYNRQQEPDNAYLSISEQPAWELLRKLRAVSPALAHFTFRQKCGFKAVPGPDFAAFCQQQSFHSPINFGDLKLVDLDFKVASLALGSSANYLTKAAFSATVDRMIAEQGGDLGVGGYGETRPFYTTDEYASRGNSGPRWRTTHLGYDVWMDAGTPVYAPLDGKVHSFKYDPKDRSYGATIILEHRPDNGPLFYTLYGHLSKSSLDGLTVGQRMSGGQQIATIGPYAENGGWPPHLHFQIMLDTLGEQGDFPGVAYPEEADLWLEICPDPRYLIDDTGLKKLATSGSAATLANSSIVADHPSSAELKSQKKALLSTSSIHQLLTRRKNKLGYSLSVSYQNPLHIVRGWQQYLLDSSGRRYLDTVNNVAHVGHEHPRVVRAGQRQMAVLNTNARYLHENILAFAEELTDTLPPALSVVHFVNSGSEANELALRMCKAWSGSPNMVAVEIGYHGNTGRTIDVSSYKFDGKGGHGAPPQTKVVPMPDVYRGLHRDATTAGKDYADYVNEAIKDFTKQGEKIGGFICESILSCGGQIVLPEGYLPAAYTHVRQAGGLCIADEVQVGLGRIGSHFWGFELQGVVPDIVTIGKPLGNGHPLAAVVCTPEVATAFANGMEYFNTFGGNPVSCAIGREVLRVIKDEELQKNALSVGNYLLDRLGQLKASYPLIGDVRGHGLFLGFELVENRKTKVPATKKARYLKNRMRQLGFLMSTDGPDENVIKIKPPLCFTQENADLLIAYLERVLKEDELRVE